MKTTRGTEEVPKQKSGQQKTIGNMETPNVVIEWQQNEPMRQQQQMSAWKENKRNEWDTKTIESIKRLKESIIATFRDTFRATFLSALRSSSPFSPSIKLSCLSSEPRSGIYAVRLRMTESPESWTELVCLSCASPITDADTFRQRPTINRNSAMMWKKFLHFDVIFLTTSICSVYVPSIWNVRIHILLLRQSHIWVAVLGYIDDKYTFDLGVLGVVRDLYNRGRYGTLQWWFN